MPLPSRLRELEDLFLTIQPARHGCRVCCLLPGEELDFQPGISNTHITRVERVVSSGARYSVQRVCIRW